MDLRTVLVPETVNLHLKGNTKEEITGSVLIRHLFLPGRFEDTADVLEWLKNNADKKAVMSLMS